MARSSSERRGDRLGGHRSLGVADGARVEQQAAVLDAPDDGRVGRAQGRGERVGAGRARVERDRVLLDPRTLAGDELDAAAAAVIAARG